MLHKSMFLWGGNQITRMDKFLFAAAERAIVASCLRVLCAAARKGQINTIQPHRIDPLSKRISNDKPSLEYLFKWRCERGCLTREEKRNRAYR